MLFRSVFFQPSVLLSVVDKSHIPENALRLIQVAKLGKIHDIEPDAIDSRENLCGKSWSIFQKLTL